MNNAIMMGLDFFEPVDRFKNEPAYQQQGQEEQ